MRVLLSNAIAIGCVNMAIVAAAPTAQRPGAPVQQWVNPGVGPASATDVNQFVRGTDAAFIGVLEGIDASFADARQDVLFTHLQFRVNEWLYTAKGTPGGERVDVLTAGGTYVEQEGKRVATGTADIARRLRRGQMYFVPIKYAYQPDLPWYGKPLLSAPDAIVSIESEHVVSVFPKSDWPQRIIASAVTVSSTPSLAGTERQRFVDAIRLAAAARK